MRQLLMTGLAAAILASGPAHAAPAPTAPPNAAIPPQARGVVLPAYVFKPGRMVDIGGRRLNLYCFGSGGPTILMLSGGGWGAVAYAGIQQKLAEKTQVCSYDRAAAGFSDVGPNPPQADQSTHDLDALIRVAGLKGPFLLVGWSAGGMEARAFAYRHPEAVAGIVTIDGSTFDFEHNTEAAPWVAATLTALQACYDAAKAGTLVKDEALYAHCRPAINPLDFMPEMRTAMAERTQDPALYAQQLAAMRGLDREADSLRAARRDLGDIPLRALVAGTHFPDADHPRSPQDEQSNRDFIFNSYKIAASVKDGRVIVLPRTKHGIHFDNPAAVIEVIETVLSQVRSKAAQ